MFYGWIIAYKRFDFLKACSTKNSSQQLCWLLFDLSIILLFGYPFTSRLLDTLYNKPCEAVGGKSEEDRQYKQNANVDDSAEHAYLFNDGYAHILDEGNVAPVKVVEIHLQGIRKNCGDGYVNGKENAHNL